MTNLVKKKLNLVLFLIALTGFNLSANKHKPIKKTGKFLTDVFRCCKFLPQYKYIALPVYKAAGGREHPLVSVPTSFAVTDLIMHRTLPEALFLAFSKQMKINFKLNPTAYLKKELFHPANRFGFACWVSLSLPVAWYKYTENKKDIN